MYRLTKPNIAIFLSIVTFVAILTAITPLRFGASRILSFSSLLLGEAAMSVIPVLALYPKASLIQAILLSVIYFLTTFTICFSAWGINSLGPFEKYAFMWKSGEFYVNIHALLVANVGALLTLVANFRLIYDEEQAKELQQKQLKQGKYKKRPFFTGFQKPLLNRPKFEESRKSTTSIPTKEKYTTKRKVESSFEEEFEKPFEFEPELDITSETLPEESSGKLFSPKIKEAPRTSEFFDDEETEEQTNKGSINQLPRGEPQLLEESKPKISQASPFPPSDIKKDLALIFEQYSSLNAIKKLTTSKIQKPYQKKEDKRKSRRPYDLPHDIPQIEVHIEGEDIHEASFRQISEEEKLQEIKEEIKTELQQKIKERVEEETQKVEETIQKTTETKEEIIQTLQNIKEEMKKELQDKIKEKVEEETQKAEETIQKTTETKEEIIENIKKIKEELLESLKEEIKKEFLEKQPEQVTKLEDKLLAEKELEEELKEVKETTQEKSQEEINLLLENLNNLNSTPKIAGSMFLTKEGKTLTEDWKEQGILHKGIDHALANLFNTINKQTNNTNQGSLCHLLLESENGTLVLADEEDKILTVYTKGTGEVYSGQILRALSEAEENL